MPTHPFERRPHWIEPQEQPSAQAPAVQPGRWLTTRLWKKSPPQASPSSAGRRPWLVVPDKLGLGEELAWQLRQEGHQVVTAEAGNAFATQGARPEQVLYLAGLQHGESLPGTLAAIEGLCRLAEALAEIPSAEGVPLALTVVTSGAYSLTGQEDVFPSSTALAAAGLSLGQQFPGLGSRIVDLEWPTDPSETRSRQRLAERLLQDLLRERPGSELAYRAGHTWVRIPQAVPASAGSISCQLRREGFYALAASKFEAAREVALELAEEGVRLLLMHSDRQDDFESEEGLVKAQLNLTNPEQVVQAMKHAEEGFGRVHGFIHLLTDVGAQTVEAALQEVTALSQASKLFELDFGLFVVAGSGREAASSQWDNSVLAGWAEGEAVRLSRKAGFPCSMLRLADASAKETAVAAQAVLASQASTDFGVSLPELRRQLAKEAPPKATGSLVRLFTQIPFEAPRNPVEQALARIWEEVLGVAPVGIHDSFLELGGHSLLATQLTAKISRRLCIDLPTSLLSEAPTLAALAEALPSRPQADADAAELPPIVHDPDSQQEPCLKALQYWRGRLDSLPGGPELPVLQAGLSAPRFQRRRGVLEAEKWQCLKRRAARIGVSQPGLLMTVFSQVLAAWSNKPRFTLNLTLNNRLAGRPELDEVGGDFTSLIPLEVDFTEPGTFEELARRLQKQLWSDLDHRQVSAVRVVRELAAQRRGCLAAALWPVVFTSALHMGSGRRRGNAVFESPGQEAYSISQNPQVWLDHQVRESSGGRLVWNWDGVEELFPEGMLDAMMEAYKQLLEELSGDQESWQQEPFGLIPFEDLELQERSNATEAPEIEGLLHQAVLEQALQRPDQPAVISRRRTLNYRQLAQLSTGLSHCLRDLEVSPDTLVAVVMEHGWEQAAAVLGILQSGAAYLPIDANLPRQRLCYLLKEGRAQVVLTQSWLDSRLEWPQDVQRIPVDTFDPAEWPDEPPPPCQEPDDLAYVIFASGSSGHPKGVMIEHGAALNTIADINRRFEVGDQDRVLAVSALNFDLSVYDIFGLLSAGGTLVVPDPDELREPARWLDWVESHRITFWNSDPALVEMLVEEAEAGRGAALNSLRLCLMSGDWIPPALAGRLRGLNPDIEVISGGGATEASIWSILYPIGEVDPDWKSIPYGRPMANQRLYVLDGQLQPRPCWVPGELYIGGDGLARGYWQDPQKTDAVFVHHPVSGQRLYRSGDLGRFLPDGNIEFLGREDTGGG